MSLLAIAVGLSTSSSQSHRVRQQAGSYEFLCAPTIACVAKIHCRSALARECGGSAKYPVTDTPHSRASALL